MLHLGYNWFKYFNLSDNLIYAVDHAFDIYRINAE